MPSHHELVHEPVAPEDLGGVAGIVHRGIPGDELGDRCGLGEGFARIAQPCGVVPGETSGVHAGAHTCKGELGILPGAQGRSEDRAALRILHSLFKASLRRTGCEGGDRDAPLVENAEEAPEPRAALSEQVGRRHAHPVEGERMRVRCAPPDLVVRRLDGETRGSVRHDDRRDLLAARDLAGDSCDRDETGDRRSRVRDELLGAVDDPFVAVEACGRARRTGVAAGLRFGEAESRQRAPGEEIRQEFFALRIVSEAEDRHGSQAHARLEGDGDRLVDAAQSFDREAQRQIVAALSAVLLREGQAEQPQLPHLGDDIHREGVRPVGLVGLRGDDRVGEVAHHGAEFEFLFGEFCGHDVILLDPRGGTQRMFSVTVH